LVLPGKALASWCAYFFDARVIDGAVNGTARLVSSASWIGRRFQTGFVRNYALTFLLGVVLAFSFLLTRAGL
jgi:NADH-quinone oxidoreductase subunit L